MPAHKEHSVNMNWDAGTPGLSIQRRVIKDSSSTYAISRNRILQFTYDIVGISRSSVLTVELIKTFFGGSMRLTLIQ